MSFGPRRTHALILFFHGSLQRSGHPVSEPLRARVSITTRPQPLFSAARAASRHDPGPSRPPTGPCPRHLAFTRPNMAIPRHPDTANQSLRIVESAERRQRNALYSADPDVG